MAQNFALDGLVPDTLDRYWQLTLWFLDIARTAWSGGGGLDRIDAARATAE